MFKKSVLASTILASSVFAIGLGLSEPASAAFQSCSGENYDISGALSPNSGCAILLPLDGEVNDSQTEPLTVNTEAFFTFTDWKVGGKWDNVNSTGGTDLSTYFNFTGNNTSGTFTRTSTPTDLLNFLFVFKDGAGTNLVGYLLSSSVTSGTYGNPFVEPPFPLTGGSDAKTVSHISVYYRTGDDGGEEQVPEPGSLLLLGGGLIGLWASRRKFARV